MTTAAASKASRATRNLEARQRLLVIADAAFSEFMAKYDGRFSIDRFLCNPKEALKLASRVRRLHGFADATDEEVLWSLLYLRKRNKKSAKGTKKS